MKRRELFKAALCAPLLELAATASNAQTPSQGRVFGSDAGMILNTIKPDRAADFETVVEKVRSALQASSDPIRKQQADGWQVFKAVEPGANNTLLYVFWISPAVKGADYTISKILYEAFPDEVQGLYKKFSESYGGGQTLVNLQLLSNMGRRA